jgi:hypothetical protein
MNKIDKIFRDRLENFHSTVPEGMWDNLDQRLSENSDRKTSRIWLLSCLVFFVLLNGLLFSLFYPKKERFTKPVSIPLSNTFLSDVTCIQNKEFAATSFVRQFTSNTLLTEKSSHSGHVQGLFAHDYPKTSVPSLVSGIIIESHAALPRELHDINDVEVQDTLMQLTPVTVAETLHAKVLNPILSTDTQLANETDIHESQSTGSAQVQVFENKTEIFKQCVKDPQAKACPFGESSRNTQVDVYMSHEYAMKHLSDPTSLNSDYLAMRNETENTVYSFSAGVRLGYNVGYRWNLYTGFNYSQINERFQYTDPESQVTKVIITKDYVYQQGKIVDSIITEEIITVPGTTKLKIHNRYRTFDVPVLGRYTLYADRNISLSAVAGVFINLAFRQKGMIIGTDSDEPVHIASGPDEQKNIFKSQLGVTGYGALSMAWHVSPLFDLVIEPHFRMHTTSLTHEKYPLQQRYNTVGLTTGLRYRF